MGIPAAQAMIAPGTVVGPRSALLPVSAPDRVLTSFNTERQIPSYSLLFVTGLRLEAAPACQDKEHESHILMIVACGRV